MLSQAIPVPKAVPGTWKHSPGLQGRASSLFPTIQLPTTQSGFPAFTADIFNPVIQSSKWQLESDLNSPHAGFVCVYVNFVRP